MGILIRSTKRLYFYICKHWDMCVCFHSDVLVVTPLRSTAFLTAFLIGELHDIWILVTNQNQFSKYLDSLLQNYKTILTMSLIGLKIDISFVLANRPAVLRPDGYVILQANGSTHYIIRTNYKHLL